MDLMECSNRDELVCTLAAEIFVRRAAVRGQHAPDAGSAKQMAEESFLLAEGFAAEADTRKKTAQEAKQKTFGVPNKPRYSDDEEGPGKILVVPNALFSVEDKTPSKPIVTGPDAVVRGLSNASVEDKAPEAPKPTTTPPKPTEATPRQDTGKGKR